MSKKRTRRTNPETFVEDDDSFAFRKRSKTSKNHQNRDKIISSRMSSKILKEALIQQKEMHDEINEMQNPDSSMYSIVEEEPLKDEEEIDDFDGLEETNSQVNDYDEEEINEDDERLLETFFSNDATFADHIAKKIKEKDASVSLEVMALPKIDTRIIELFKGVGKLMSTYTAGKVPKAFRHILAMESWEYFLHLTEPEKWSPKAVFQATKIFASNMGVEKAVRFYKLVLLPRLREDIRKNKNLHFYLYQALRKSLFKPAAFFKGILFPLCESRTCSLREAVIFGSVLHKNSIPYLHSSTAIVLLFETLLMLCEMEYCGTTRYKNGIRKEDKDDLRKLTQVQWHRLVIPLLVFFLFRYRFLLKYAGN